MIFYNYGILIDLMKIKGIYLNGINIFFISIEVFKLSS